GITLFWMDFGSLELARDAGRRRLITFPVAGDFALIYSGSSVAGVLASRRRARSSGGNLASRVFRARGIGKGPVPSSAAASPGVSFSSHLFLLCKRTDGAVVLAAQCYGQIQKAKQPFDRNAVHVAFHCGRDLGAACLSSFRQNARAPLSRCGSYVVWRNLHFARSCHHSAFTADRFCIHRTERRRSLRSHGRVLGYSDRNAVAKNCW